MLSFLIAESMSLLRTVQIAAHALLLFAIQAAFVPLALRSEEPRIVSLKGFESVEVRQQGFTLPSATKVHIYAKGGGVRLSPGRRPGEGPLFAYGWILNAATREVVWQMDGTNTKRTFEQRIADQYVDLPAGSYEAYFANHGFAQSLLFAQWSRNIDRRDLSSGRRDRARGLQVALGLDEDSLLRRWLDEVGEYGLEIYLPGGDPSQVPVFDAPLRWKNILIALSADKDGGYWTQAFHVQKPTTLHLYGEGEGSGSRMSDSGWIINARTRERVWEMSMDKSQFAGGAPKNRRQVETIQLPAGDYEATFVTDGSHSPADWNSAPPCDPGMYGLTISAPSAGDMAAFSLRKPLDWPVLAELVRVGDDQDRSLAFMLNAALRVRVYAVGEGDGDDMADGAWIEDASGKKVWTMERSRTQHAGGSTKNRMADEVISLPKGTYTLRYHTDDSHAYGDWNSTPPWDQERYGVTVYGVR